MIAIDQYLYRDHSQLSVSFEATLPSTVRIPRLYRYLEYVFSNDINDDSEKSYLGEFLGLRERHISLEYL